MTRAHRPVVTIGNFDGVHRGHAELIDRAVARARALASPCVALTFDPHPAAVLRPGGAPPALQSVASRAATLRQLGVDEVVVLPFDAALAARSPAEFVAEVIVARLAAREVVVGDNFRFGRSAAGDVALLRELCQPHGIAVDAVPLVGVSDPGGAPVSSTGLRALLAAGDVAAVTAGLGRPFELVGPVTRGEGRGRTIGVPTANVAVAAGLALPADGVYACRARVEPVSAGPESARAESAGPAGSGDAGPGCCTGIPAVVNVGWRPTFAGTTRTVEAHLLDHAADLYGRTLRLAFVARIRGEERFEGPAALVARIQQDIAAARGLLSG